ncbi:MAG: DUF1801 domain-containing protein [Flavobacteriales bacterium]|nr:DUF1801 domain-containing protein [Flavobacteriales bacterium]|tara:strand:+ start:1049 stop:1393 length:345 start_codon:yes stop_codon:yes gene_type:complete
MTELENFYNNLSEPNKGCFLYIRKLILDHHPDFTEHWKWKLPFFSYQGKPFCYIWKDKKTTIPYLTFVRSLNINRPELELGTRKQMKALTINPNEDIDVFLIKEIIDESLTYFN